MKVGDVTLCAFLLPLDQGKVKRVPQFLKLQPAEEEGQVYTGPYQQD